MKQLRHNKLQGRIAKRASTVESEAVDQTDKDLTESTVARRKKLLQLREENLFIFYLKEELEKKTSANIFQENLKFYAGST